MKRVQISGLASVIFSSANHSQREDYLSYNEIKHREEACVSEKTKTFSKNVDSANPHSET